MNPESTPAGGETITKPVPTQDGTNSPALPSRATSTTPLTPNVINVDKSGMHTWLDPHGNMIGSYYRLAPGEIVFVLWDRDRSGTIIGKSITGSGETVRDAYTNAYNELRLHRYDKRLLRRQIKSISRTAWLLLDTGSKLAGEKMALLKQVEQMKEGTTAAANAVQSAREFLELYHVPDPDEKGTIPIRREEWLATIEKGASYHRQFTHYKERCEIFKGMAKRATEERDRLRAQVEALQAQLDALFVGTAS